MIGYDNDWYEEYRRKQYRRYMESMYSRSNKSKYAIAYLLICDKISMRESREQVKKEYGFVETHHILPRCMCDDVYQLNDKYNNIHCTPREHFILHKLLTKMFCFNNKIHKKMVKAMTMFKMSNKSQMRILNSIQYNYVRKCAISASSGKNNPMFGTNGTLKGRKAYNNGERTIFLKKSDKIPDGFHKGSHLKNKMVTITNGSHNKSISKHDAIPDGWWIGSKTKGTQSKIKGKPRIKYPSDKERNIKISLGSKDKMWITNGIHDMKISIKDQIPESYRKGRSTGFRTERDELGRFI